MTQVCPACTYVRKSTDEAPDWQCPGCKVAYVDALARENLPDRSAALTTTRKRSSRLAFIWVTIMVLLGGLVWAYNLAPQRGAANGSATAAGQPTVILYSTTWCGYCAAAREFFKAHNIQYTDMDIEKSPQGFEEHKNFGGNGVPLIRVGEHTLRGYSENALRQTLGPWLKSS